LENQDGRLLARDNMSDNMNDKMNDDMNDNMDNGMDVNVPLFEKCLPDHLPLQLFILIHIHFCDLWIVLLHYSIPNIGQLGSPQISEGLGIPAMPFGMNRLSF
jgi:hypothetical protein